MHMCNNIRADHSSLILNFVEEQDNGAGAKRLVCVQGRIQDFWIGGSNSERGVRFPSFASFFLKFPMEMK